MDRDTQQELHQRSLRNVRALLDKEEAELARAKKAPRLLLYAMVPALALVDRDEIMKLFQGLVATGITVVLVTHERDISAYASRLVHIRDGQIVADTHGSAPRAGGPPPPAGGEA